MTDDRRRDMSKYVGQLIMSAIVGGISCVITLYATTRTLEARMISVEARQERLTTMIDHLDEAKVDKGEFKEALEGVKNSIEALRADLREQFKQRR